MDERGIASWYGEPYHGRVTASGEIFDMHTLSAAHRTLKFGSLVRVKRLDTGASVTVRINDRGPFIKGRIIDLSYAAARKIGLDRDGVAPVEIEVLEAGNGQRKSVARTGDEKECFWIQVGAFSSRENAIRARKNLENRGERVVIMEGPRGLTRVRVGPFSTTVEADQALVRIGVEWPAAGLVECGG